jgi:hypothetical protein
MLEVYHQCFDGAGSLGHTCPLPAGQHACTCARCMRAPGLDLCSVCEQQQAVFASRSCSQLVAAPTVDRLKKARLADAMLGKAGRGGTPAVAPLAEQAPRQRRAQAVAPAALRMGGARSAPVVPRVRGARSGPAAPEMPGARSVPVAPRVPGARSVPAVGRLAAQRRRRAGLQAETPERQLLPEARRAKVVRAHPARPSRASAFRSRRT